MYQDWPERDDLLLEAVESGDRYPLLEWSVRRNIRWPTCNARCWALIHTAALYVLKIDLDTQAHCAKFLRTRHHVLDPNLPGLLFNGEETIPIPDNLKLA